MATHMITRFYLQSRVCLPLNHYRQQLIRFQSNQPTEQEIRDLEDDNEFRKLELFPTKKAERTQQKRYTAEVKFKKLFKPIKD